MLHLNEVGNWIFIAPRVKYIDIFFRHFSLMLKMKHSVIWEWVVFREKRGVII